MNILKQKDNLDFIISRISKEMAKEMLDFNGFLQMSEGVERKKTTFIIKKDLLEKAERLGLLGRNLSFFVERFLERFLPEYERFIEGLDADTPGVGFEPTNPYGQGISSPPQWPSSATPAQTLIEQL